MRPRIRLTKDRRAARRAKTPMHGVAAVCDTAVIMQLATHGNGAAREADVYRRAAGAKVLAYATPAGARDDRFGADAIAHRFAQASTSNFHDELRFELLGDPRLRVHLRRMRRRCARGLPQSSCK